MKSYEELGRSAHAAYVQSLPESMRLTASPWEKLRPEVRESWANVAKAVAAELSTIL